MKLDADITRYIEVLYDRQRRWPDSLAAGGLSWQTRGQRASFRTVLPSGQDLQVHLQRAGGRLSRITASYFELDGIGFGWHDDTSRIESATVRAAVEALGRALAPIARAGIAEAAADARRKDVELKAAASRQAADLETAKRAAREAALRKADGTSGEEHAKEQA